MRDQPKGSTLLELLIALCLLTIGMMGIMALGLGIMKNNTVSKQRSIAVQLAQSKMEVIFSMAYSDVADDTETALNAEGVPGAGIFDRAVEVLEFSDPEFKNVRVNVTWESAGKYHETLYSSISAPK